MARHLCAEHGRDQAVDEDAVDDRTLKGGGPGVGWIQVEGVVVPRQLSKQLHIAGGEGFGEGRSLANMEEAAEGWSYCDGSEAEPRVV